MCRSKVWLVDNKMVSLNTEAVHGSVDQRQGLWLISVKVDPIMPTWGIVWQTTQTSVQKLTNACKELQVYSKHCKCPAVCSPTSVQHCLFVPQHCGSNHPQSPTFKMNALKYLFIMGEGLWGWGKYSFYFQHYHHPCETFDSVPTLALDWRRSSTSTSTAQACSLLAMSLLFSAPPILNCTRLW